MSAVAEARELLDRALAYKLDGSQEYANYPIELLAERWNGVGPAWMMEKARKKLSKWLKLFLPACFVHDQDFSESNGLIDGFVRANDRLERNCRIIADAEYPRWYDVRRYFARRGAELVADTCRLTAWPAWRDAYKECDRKKEGAHG